MYLGDFALGSTVDVYFTSRQFSTGAPFALAGSPAVAAYPDNSTTEITAGITLTTNFDTRTGLNQVRVLATSGNGYAAGSTYALVITAGTVDSVSVVGEVIAMFSLEARSGLRPTVAGRTLDVTATGEAGVDLDNTAGSLAKGTDLTGFNDLSAADIRTAVGLSSANLDTQLGDLQSDTDDLQTRLPAALVNGRMDSDVQAVAGNATTPTIWDRSARTVVRVTVDTGATTTSIPTASLIPAAEAVDQFRGRVLLFDLDTTTTALRGQAASITASTATGVLSVSALTDAPVSGDTAVIV